MSTQPTEAPRPYTWNLILGENNPSLFGLCSDCTKPNLCGDCFTKVWEVLMQRAEAQLVWSVDVAPVVPKLVCSSKMSKLSASMSEALRCLNIHLQPEFSEFPAEFGTLCNHSRRTGNALVKRGLATWQGTHTNGVQQIVITDLGHVVAEGRAYEVVA